MSKVLINVVSCVVIAGQIRVPGSEDAIAVEVSNELARNLFDRGAAVPHVAEVADAGNDGGSDDDVPLVDMTVPQLKEIAAGHEIEGYKAMNKADLIAAIETAEAE